MPVRLTVTLKSVHVRAVPPHHTGPAVYAAFLNAVAAAHPTLSAALHDAPKYKPFTLTPLLDAEDNAPRTPGGPARFEVGLLAEELTGPVFGALADHVQYRIGNTQFRMADVSITSAQSYETLAQQADSHASWDFRLVTPVSFATAKEQGPRRQQPWPDPVRVLHNLADRWNTFAGVALPPQVWDVISNHVEVSAGQLRIVEYLVEPGRRGAPAGYRKGSVGTVSYRLASAESVAAPILRAVDALASFAEWAGFGDRTAIGMGHVRRRHIAVDLASRQESRGTDDPYHCTYNETRDHA